MRRWVWFCATLSVLCSASARKAGGADEILKTFGPSTLQSAYGSVSQAEFSTELLELEAGVLAHHLHQGMKRFRFDEAVWVIGYRTEILDASQKPPRENYLCHTFFGDQRVTQHDDQEMVAIYSDAFTPEVRLPEGYGLYVPAGETLHWMPMFNNREEKAVRVRMKTVLSVIREKDRAKPLKRLYTSLRSVRTPHLFFVSPGTHTFQTTFQAPFDGRIHFMGTHIHPHGVSIELYDIGRARQVWRSNRKLSAEGRLIGMDVFSSEDGYAVASGQEYRITALYDNRTSGPIDAMAGLFLLYTRD